MENVHTLSGGNTPQVKVEQRANGLFRVTYGAHVRDNLTYVEAAHEFGECAFHSFTCSGLIESVEDDEG